MYTADNGRLKHKAWWQPARLWAHWQAVRGVLWRLWPLGSWDSVDGVVALPAAGDRLAQLSDEALVELVQSRGGRDDRPFAALMTRYQTMVWRVCYGYFRNAEDAEDLAQEVFVKVYRNLAHFEGRAQFKTWVYRIAINACQNELRARARRPVASPTELETAAEFIPSAQDVEAEMGERGQHEALLAALAQLRPEEFQLLVWKDVEGLQYDEIARTLGIGVSAAKMRVQRARTALQVQYRQIAGEEVTT